MKTKNKGFTLIELVLGLSLIVLIILPVFGVVISYKNKEIMEANKADLTSFKNRVLTTIESDIVEKGVQYTCEYIHKISDTDYLVENNTQRIMFRDHTYADLTIDHEQKSIIYTTYDEENKKIDEQTFVLPVQDAVLENASYIRGEEGHGTGISGYDYFYIFPPNEIQLKKYTDGKTHYENDIAVLDNNSTVLKIFLPITYEGDDYSIVITTTFTYEVDSPSCGANTENGNYCPYSNKNSYVVSDDGFTCTNNFLSSR